MAYTIIEHNDEQRTIHIDVEGTSRILLYPNDINLFEEMTTSDLDLWIGGFVNTSNAPTESETPVTQQNQWIY
tara:strand:- start:10 stop:228 length:219 start_codon:yes stop_codon:yes gene_type:complete